MMFVLVFIILCIVVGVWTAVHYVITKREAERDPAKGARKPSEFQVIFPPRRP
jgi:hypothetical protein